MWVVCKISDFKYILRIDYEQYSLYIITSMMAAMKGIEEWLH